MSDESKHENAGKDLRIDDLPPKATEPEEEDATKGGYSSSTLSGVGILHETLPILTAILDDGTTLIDGT